jgi:hypothetical protein
LASGRQFKKVAKRGGQKPRRENGHANIDGQRDNEVIDAFTPLEKFHGGKRRRVRLVPINGALKKAPTARGMRRAKEIAGENLQEIRKFQFRS